MPTRFIVLSVLTIAACASEPELRYVDVGVEVRLNAVAEFGIVAGSFIAVGSGGIVVDSDGEQWDLGDIELRDVAWGHDRASYDYTLTWMVVGDQGTAAFAVAEDALDMEYLPLKWTTLELGIESDLHAVNFREDPPQIVVAGDETLRVRPSWKFEFEEWEEEPQWIEPSPPPGGWGRLRALFPGPGRLWAAGEEGRLLWSDGDLTTWTVDDPNTTVNLNGGCFWNGRAWLVGDDGFIAYISSDSAWVRESLGTKADLLSFEYPFGVIASDRTIRMVSDDRGELVTDWVLPFDWQPRDISQHFAVGDGGQVVLYDEGIGYR
jgi:hypothetical protein